VSDDIVTRLRERAIILFSNGADGNAFIDEQAADEIERLRIENSELRGKVLEIDKTGQELWSMVSSSRDSYADEVMYLREENNKASAFIARLTELLLPYSVLMSKEERELLIKAVRGE